ncbi:alpha-2-macroglobulin family protein [uncultured Kordia sp.]|uniref:alpha-2-macroglobulin family protein n=1 Tax=uncultured Kordia sp. TaxID=507699 RepID=UPI002604582F|nr:alpha-2-macroglobulin family protein [uncultured Kordia sp.]
MKNILTIFMIVLFSQFSNAQQEYSNLWKEVERLEKKGLTKSAFERVSEISKRAKRDRNNPQIIKTFLKKASYQMILEEDAQLTIVNDLKAEIATQSFPSKNILQSILGTIYWEYFSGSRYLFYNRTETSEKVDANDFRTWDLQTLFKEIHKHFDASFENATQLQKLDLSEFDVILHTEKDSKIYRPTVYDLLAHNALKFYKSDENNLASPAYAFVIDDPEYLCDATIFAKMDLTTKDTFSLEARALKIYQDLIRFHLKDKSPEALIKVNIERLYFVKQKATFDDKIQKLIEAFQNEKTTFASHPYSGMYDAETAVLHQQQGSSYNSITKPEHQWSYKKAIQLCDAVITKFPNSIAEKKCKIIKYSTEKPSISILTENYLPIDQASKLLVTYKNTDSLYFSTSTISLAQYNQLSKLYSKEDRFEFLKKLSTQQQWNVKLPTENDYQSHTTEVSVPKLTNGYHVIIASENPDLQNDYYAFGVVQVTNMAIVHKSTTRNSIFQLTDRNTGKPIANQEVAFKYSERSSKDELTKTMTTDATGSIVFDNEYSLRNVHIHIKNAAETAYFGQYYIYKNRRSENADPKINLFFFTDRSIYRPAQTNFFKGILVKTADKKSTVLSNRTVIVTLHDTNHQEVSEQTLVTNEYGSIKGEFILPNSGLTGNFSLQAYVEGFGDVGSTYFSVEEYKRPKFEANFLPVKESYSVNDEVIAKGTAKAFAGSNISDAKVSYTVKRTPRYPVWAFWRRPYVPSTSQQITSGETTTDATGNFEVSFKAIPDASVDKELLPIFDYEVSANITDINGETRSAKTTIRVGYHTLTANINIDRKLDATKRTHTLEVITKNLNGEKVTAKGTVTIHKLQAPDRVLRQRPWLVPDYKMISEEEFKTTFPHDAYTREEADYKKWAKGKQVFSKSFDTKNDSILELGRIKRWESGKYIVELKTTDANGMEIKDMVYTNVWNKNDDFTADKKLLDVSIDKDSYMPNETVVLTLASATKDMHVTIDIEKDHEIVNTYIISLEDGKQQVKIPVLKTDEGGFKIHCTATVFNSIVSQVISVVVAYPPSELQIETTTFRDKLKPGQEETWSFRIKGSKGEKVAAELLTSMYDASLDEFKSHQWEFSPLYEPGYYSSVGINGSQSFGTSGFTQYHSYKSKYYDTQSYDKLNWFGFRMQNARNQYLRKNVLRASQRVESTLQGIAAGVEVVNDAEEVEAMALMDADEGSQNANFKEKDSTTSLGRLAGGFFEEAEENKTASIIPRKNLQETAFFFPQLQTDTEGNVSFSFTTPEALTKWKLQLLAHTKDLHSATKSLTTVTQKELMVLPNIPRFLREGDKIVISSKISNLSENNLTGEASLELVDPITGNDINPALFPRTGNPKQAFSVDANGNTQVSWTLYIPKTIQAIQYTIIAKAGAFSDGEQGALPVLSNRMLVTETLPMWIRSNETKTFTLDKLSNTNSSTLQHHKLSLEVTSNPAWYAVQALPYLMEYPYECAEQTFSRYYANALASHIANSNPRIQEVFNQWKSSDALLSNLEKNQELKSLLIQETPWVRDAQSETEQKKRIALLFDLNRMKNEQSNTISKLQQMQLSSGGFPWFSGGRANRFITQHIIAGYGHLDKLGVRIYDSEKASTIIEKAIAYLDAEFIKEYHDIRKYDKKVDLSKDHLSYSQLHYLYMRSFFPQFEMSKEALKISDYYTGQITKYWLNRSLYAKGLMALVSHRYNNPKTANTIIRSLQENSITSDELGMYWKANTSSWYWYQAPIETQALMIEAFSEISQDITTIDNLKIWLLKNKQTNRWSTTKATSDAVYALLLQGSDWLSVTDMVDITIGDQKISPTTLENVKVEAGTGYFKTSWNGNEVKPEMAKVTLTKKGKGIAWGGLYWQYFEDLDKITTAETSLKLSKKLFKRTYGDTGEILTAIDENSKLELGDLIRVRIELRNDRAMEFVHMKDMRAAGLEPINVLSQYKWQDGLGYYESTKDASTNFFFDYLPKGVFVFEYDLRVNNIGEFSNGITTIQSMYAPEFSSHSEGVRIKVD